MIFNETDSAKLRIANSLASLKNLTRKNMMLEDVASAIVHANHLMSALALIYDGLYEVSKASGLIDRVLVHPLADYDRKKGSDDSPTL